MTLGASLGPKAGKAVVAILLLDVLLFLPSFGNFFCGDSLYFLSRRGDEWREPVRVFTTLDTLQSYRPLTHVVFDYLMYPLSRLDPRGYQVMTRVLHLATALLVYFLLKRLTRSPGAALLGLFVYAVHSENFYLSYDPSFLPDLLVGLCGAAALLSYAHGRRLASAAFFGLALLSKESALTLLAGLAVVGLLAERDQREPLAGAARRQFLALTPHLSLAAAYLLLQVFLRRGAIFPTEPGPYSLSWSWWTLWLKTKYLAWMFNLSADWERRRWWLFPPLLLMLPALTWLLGSLRNAWRRDARPLLLCAAWALASLAPVLLIRQVPMKHNLQFSVLALSVVVAVSLDGRYTAGRLLPRSAWWLIVPMILSTAFHVRNDLRYSWVAEGSGVAERSLAAVRAAYPELPRGAILYLLPSVTRGNISWYFDGGGLFRLFYADPKLDMRFANLKHRPPPDAGERHDVFFFRFREGDRLYDVTPDYRAELRDTESDRLLRRFNPDQSRSAQKWSQGLAPQGRAVIVGQHLGGSTLREALITLPGATAAFALREVPPGAVLLLGLALAGNPRNGSAGSVWFESGEEKLHLYRVMLDPATVAGHWWDGEVDLHALRGRSGTLCLENVGDPSADWLAWSRLRIVSRSSRYYTLQERGSRPLSDLVSTSEAGPAQTTELRLLDQAETAPVEFDRREYYPDYEHFDTPNGKPVFPQWTSRAQPARRNLVTAAGARVRFVLPALPPGAVLQASVTHGTSVGDGVLGRIYWEHGDRRELLFERMVHPHQTNWFDEEISLSRWAGKAGVLCLEASSGPRGNTVGDWLAWGRMRIVW